MPQESLKERYQKIESSLNKSGLSDILIKEIQWLASIVFTSTSSINKKSIMEKCHEYGDLELGSAISTALNEKTLLSSLSQKLDELLVLVEQSDSVSTNVTSIKAEKKSDSVVASTSILNEVQPNKSLWFYNGVRVSSLPQMYARLNQIDDNTFAEHVNEYKHDISDWVKNSLHDDNLSNKLSEGRTKEEVQNIIEKAMHEKIQSTLDDSKNLHETDTGIQPTRLEDEIKILDALELPDLPEDIGRILGVKVDKNIKIPEKKNETTEKNGKNNVEQIKNESIVQQEIIEKSPETNSHNVDPIKTEANDAAKKYEQDGITNIVRKNEQIEEEKFNSFMELLEDVDEKTPAKEVILPKEQEKYVPKTYTAATQLFVSKEDKDEKQSMHRYQKVEKKLKDREASLSSIEQDLESLRQKITINNDHEEEFDLQEKLAVKSKEIKKIREDISTLRRTLDELHKTPLEFKERADKESEFSISREKILTYIHDAASAEDIIDTKSILLHPTIKRAKPIVVKSETNFNKKEQYNPVEEQKKIDNEIDWMRTHDNGKIKEPEKFNEVVQKTSSSDIEKILNQGALKDEVFFCKNGSVLRKLSELYSLLNKIDKDSFSYHVNPSKNDFAVWTEHSLKLVELGKLMSKSRTREGIIKIIEKWIIKNDLESYIGLEKKNNDTTKIVELKVEQTNAKENKSEPKIQAQSNNIKENSNLNTNDSSVKKINNAKILKPVQPKPKNPEEMLQYIHEHIEADNFDNALKMIGNLRRHMQANKKKKKNDLEDKMTEYELKALESDIKILKLKHS